ncbi:2-dehydropantoate 2-reductase [Flavobacteriaceae bacterium UJ101]|nr:2-dehydropantoate 2-reductase [Flavobacteriaceae bacterium UJ101]
MERILIIGTGGVGGYFGGKMAQANFDVTFVARGKHFEAIKEKGLYVKSINGSFLLPKVKVVQTISEVEEVDIVFVCTKSNQVEEIAKQLSSVIHDETIIIPLLNGITAENQLSEYSAEKNIVHGLVKIFSKIEDYGIINHFGYEPTMVFGNSFHQNISFLDRLETVIKASEITYKRSEDILSDKWQKFIFICSGGLTTIARATYGEIRENKETRELLINLLQEITDLGVINKVNLPENLVEKTMKMIDGFPYEATSSMQRDFYDKKPSEIDFLTGEVVRLASKSNFSVPINRFIYSCLKIQEGQINPF